MANTGDRRALAGMTVVVVLLHLAAFGALYQLGGGRAAFVVAYLLGLRWAFDPGNTAAVRGFRGRGVTAGFWFALGFATTVAVLALLFTAGVRMIPWNGARPAPVFLGILAVLEVVVLVRARRDDGRPVRRPGLDRLIRWARRPWQLYPVGALFGAVPVLAAEIVLLVLAAGTVVPTMPLYLTIVLPLLFAAGMCLAATLRGVFAMDARTSLPHTVLAGAVVAGAVAGAAMLLNGTVDPALIGLVDDAQAQPAELAGYLIDQPFLLLFLLLLLVVALVVRRLRPARNNEEDAATGATGGATARRDPGASARRPARRPAPAQPAPAPAAAPQPMAQAPVYPVVPQAPYRQQVVARATAAPVPPATAGVAIVAGAGAGVGRAIALGLARAGYGIVAVDIDGAGAAACAAQARSYGVAAQAVGADPRDPFYLERVVAVAEEWGRTSVLVTASIAGWPSPARDRTAEIYLSGLVREPMRRRGGGAVVNVVPAVSAEAAALIRWTANSAGARDGVRLMCLTTDQLATAPAAVVAAVLDLIRRGGAGTVVELAPRFARGTAAVG